MKRKTFLILGLIVFIVLAAIVLWSRRNHDAPRFVPGTPASLPPFDFDYFGWLDDTPFQNDKVWLLTDTRPQTHAYVYLYDLRRRVILGELFNGWVPELSSRDGSRVLFIGSDFPESSFPDNVLRPALKIFGIKLPPPSRRTEILWTLDLSRNSAKQIGAISQFSGEISSWHPSPDSRFGYTVPSISTTSLSLCDLEHPSLIRISISGNPVGWWDEQNILIESGSNQFALLDISTQTTRNLFSPADFQNVLDQSGITNDSAATYPLANWNGSNYDFYFGIRDQVSGLQGSNSFLLKTSASSPHLALLYPHFQFRWGGRLDASGKLYLFSGESGKPGYSGGDGSVYLRDLTHGTVSTLVPPKIKGQYTSPRFYGNEVIYFRDGLIHRIGLDGSNDTPIFLPPAK